MARSPKPTDAELAVLRVLWSQGASTVREVHDAIRRTKPITYTSTLKTLQVMTEKGITAREDLRGQHVYRPVHAEKDTLRRLVTDLLDRAFGGSTSKLVIQALASRRATEDELQEIRRLLDARQGRGRQGGGRG